MSALTIAAAGMSTATNQFAASAERTASGRSDLTAETVEQISQAQAFSASATVAKSADDMMKRLLDIRV